MPRIAARLPSRLLLGVAILAAACFAGSVHGPHQRAAASGPLQMYIDGDARDGLCNDASNHSPVGSEVVGGTYRVGVCIQDQSEAPAAFEETISFTTAVTTGPEIPDVFPMLNDNPDANDGAGSTHLGVDWNCSGLGFSQTQLNDGNGHSHISCNAFFTAPVGELTASPGLLVTITYTATAPGTNTLAFSTDGTSSVAGPVSNCAIDINCYGATITHLADTDGDLMPDVWEQTHPCVNQNVADGNTDPDGDGIPSATEYAIGSNPCLADSDGDGMPDAYEATKTCIFPGVNDGAGDADGDGVTNFAEFTNGTDPCKADTDNDGLSDGAEITAGTNPLNPDTDSDGVLDGAEAPQGTSPLNPDTDGDGFKDKPATLHVQVNANANVDNCPAVANPSQLNTDSALVDNGPGIAGDDGSNPNSDALGDACDPDIDNDGLPNAQDTEPLGATGICATFSGSNDGSLQPAGGDVTNDDNHNGNPAPPMGTDPADNGPSWDTDNDGVLDGVECQLGTNPRDPLSKPSTAQCGGTSDNDSDGLSNAAERCKWGTDPIYGYDKDGDGKKDCVEAADINGDGFLNFPGDTIWLANAATGHIGKTMDLDLNGDNVVNFPGDVILSAQMAFHIGNRCPP